MIKDTIYREDAIKAVKNVSENYTKEGDREWHPHVDFIIQALVEVPSIPSEDRPQGEWIVHSNGKMCDCSVCNESYDRTFEYVDEWNFCPNCGARMKGADDGNK